MYLFGYQLQKYKNHGILATFFYFFLSKTQVIRQSQENVKALSAKINELDELQKNIIALKKQPEIMNAKFQQVVELSETYTNTLGAATKKYLDGNNMLFADKLQELSHKTNDLQTEITRLVNTDINVLFQKLQKTFIEQTRKDIAEELSKLDGKLELFQSKIDELKTQAKRFEDIEFEKYFDNLQKTLSDIFGAINSINSILTHVTQSLQNIIRSLGDIQTSITDNHKAVNQSLEKYNSIIERHLDNQDKELSAIKDKINFLEMRNSILQKRSKVLLILTHISAFLILGAFAFIVLNQK
jgi:methyl-accepting chemotaxis protein